MKIIKHFKDVENELSIKKSGGKCIGFVPTMGALHEGHLSLINTSNNNTDFTVVSIFVNPTQFNNKEDLKRYPRNVGRDVYMLEAANCDLLFLPDESEIYPPGFDKEKKYDLGDLENILEGEFRPGHFQGVCMVVERLLSQIKPDKIFIGQKDFQQCLVIEKLVKIMGIKTEVAICPTLREPSGLAMSSRNERLSVEERKIAANINLQLQHIAGNIKDKSFPTLKNESIKELEKLDIKVEYLDLVDREAIAVVDKYLPENSYAIVIAAYVGQVRLIDNMIL